MSNIDADHPTTSEPGPIRSENWIASHPDLLADFTPNQVAFLEVFAERASIQLACESIGISRTAYYKWMHDDENFRMAFTSARQMAIQSLEDEVIRRGMHGVEEPVFGKGGVIGTKTKYSDTLLMFYLNGNAPEKYRNRSSLEHSGPNGGPLTIAALDELMKD